MRLFLLWDVPRRGRMGSRHLGGLLAEVGQLDAALLQEVGTDDEAEYDSRMTYRILRETALPDGASRSADMQRRKPNMLLDGPLSAGLLQSRWEEKQ